MSSRKFSKSNKKTSTTFPSIFGKKQSDQIFTPEPANDAHDASNSPLNHNFGHIKVENSSFKKSCSLSLSGPAHCPFGGVCHTCPEAIQTKLKINTPGDKYEKEADRVAETIMSTPVIQRKECTTCGEDEDELLQTKSISHQITPLIQRQVEEEDDETDMDFFPEIDDEDEEIMMKTVQPGSKDIGPGITGKINNTRGKGARLPADTLNFMENRFGTSFKDVRIHADNKSSELNDSIKSKAFTIDRDIYFNRNYYQPNAPKGRKLLAHELTHVLQQSGVNYSHRTGAKIGQLRTMQSNQPVVIQRAVQGTGVRSAGHVLDKINKVLNKQKALNKKRGPVKMGKLAPDLDSVSKKKGRKPGMLLGGIFGGLLGGGLGAGLGALLGGALSAGLGALFGGVLGIVGGIFLGRYLLPKIIRSRARSLYISKRQLRSLLALGEAFHPGKKEDAPTNAFVYTCKGGWIDMGHFFFTAAAAYAHKNLTWIERPFIPTAMKLAKQTEEGQQRERELFKKRFTDPRLLKKFGAAPFRMPPITTKEQKEKIKKQMAELTKDQKGERGTVGSAYTIEDMPSNKFGAEFGKKLSPDDNIHTKMYNFFKEKGAVEPKGDVLKAMMEETLWTGKKAKLPRQHEPHMKGGTEPVLLKNACPLCPHAPVCKSP